MHTTPAQTHACTHIRLQRQPFKDNSLSLTQIYPDEGTVNVNKLKDYQVMFLIHVSVGQKSFKTCLNQNENEQVQNEQGYFSFATVEVHVKIIMLTLVYLIF